MINSVFYLFSPTSTSVALLIIVELGLWAAERVNLSLPMIHCKTLTATGMSLRGRSMIGFVVSSQLGEPRLSTIALSYPFGEADPVKYKSQSAVSPVRKLDKGCIQFFIHTPSGAPPKAAPGAHAPPNIGPGVIHILSNTRI